MKEDLRHHRHRRLCLFLSFWNLVCQGLSFLSFLLLPLKLESFNNERLQKLLSRKVLTVIVLIPALLSSFVILLLLLGREGWQLFTDTKEKKAKTLDWMYYPILFSRKSLRLTKHRSCKIGEDGQLR